MKQARRNIWAPVAMAIMLALGLFTGFVLENDAPMISVREGTNGTNGDGKIEQILGYIEARYVDEPDANQLYETAIREILGELDPHSSYFAEEEMQALTESMEGNFEGIGIEYLVVQDTITVVSTIPNGPSAAAGLLPGDQIVYVEDSLIINVEENGIDPASLMRGQEGSSVNVRVQRSGEPELMSFNITRAPIPVYSVDAAYPLDDETAYVKINRFSQTTYSEFMEALKTALEEPNAKNLILDLRGNPGGYLQEATKILSEFFQQRGVLLVYTEGRNSSRQPYKSNGRARYNIQDIAVLVDGKSASASEIVAGALQDHDRGIVVGRRTFGKGLVQEQYPLSDGSALRLTVARYYTPSDRSIQRDYEGEEDYRGDLGRRFASGELTGRTEIAVDSSLIYYTDNGHPVFGGGGIVPDHFVPLDSSLNDKDYLRLRQQVPAYIFSYLRSHPSVREFENVEDFVRNFELELGPVIADLTQLVSEAYEETPQAPSGNLREELSLFFRARLARQLFGPTAFYEVYNREDEVVQHALALLREKDPLAAARSEGEE